MQELEALDLEGADNDNDENGTEGYEDDAEVETAAAPVASTSAGGKLAKGFGRIERDENGKVIRIVLAGDDGEEITETVKTRQERGDDSDEDDDEGDDDTSEEEDSAMSHKDTSTPWGQPIPDWEGEGSRPIEWEEEDEQVNKGTSTRGQGIPIGGRFTKVQAKTDVVRGKHSAMRTENSSLENAT
jgi:hypothetical protein